MTLPRRLRTTTSATLRKTLRETLDSLGDEGPVVVVSAGGDQRGVLVSPADYDQLLDELDAALTREALARAEAQAARGEVREGTAGFADFELRNGLA